YGVHVTEPDLGIPGSLVHGMVSLRIKAADGIPSHPGPPDRMPRNVDVVSIAKYLAVDFEIGAEFSLFAPQSRLAQQTIFGIQVFFPKLPRFHNMAVAVKNRKTLLASLVHHAGVLLYCTSTVRLFARVLGNLKRCLAGHCGFRLEGLLYLLFAWPPVRPLDFTDALPDDGRGGFDFVEAARIIAQHLGLKFLRELALLHRLDGSPSVVAVVVIDVRRPGGDFSVVLR